MAKHPMDSFDDADNFWQLSDMTPRRTEAPRRSSDVETVSVKYPPIKDAPQNRSGQKIDFDQWLRRKRDAAYRIDDPRDGDDVKEYRSDNPLILRVKSIHRKGYDRVLDRGISDMLSMWGRKARFVENTEFTALFPQYARMTEEQKQCYFGFRDEVMNGRYPKVDESYILLFLYEIINLAEQIPPQRGVELICSLMLGYKDCSDTLFSSMCDWLEDYCLIHEINAPLDLLSSIREKVYKRASWKEFYVPFKTDVTAPDACVMIATSSSYDYRSSRFYNQATAETFETHIPAAVGAAILAISAIDPTYASDNRDTTTLIREAFRGAYRSAGNRYTVSVECYCFTRSPLLRQTVTALVKYAENFVREMLGVPSRLTVSCLGADKKQLVKQYFEPYVKRASDLPPTKRGRKRMDQPTEYVDQIPEYEKWYEPPKVEFSAELAQKIEQDSWKTTDLLISAFADEANSSPEVSIREAEHLTEQESGSAEMRAVDRSDDTVAAAIRLLLDGKVEEFKALALGRGLMPETLAEMINSKAIEVYGDIAIDLKNGFDIIDDYRDELNEMAVSGVNDPERNGDR